MRNREIQNIIFSLLQETRINENGWNSVAFGDVTLRNFVKFVTNNDLNYCEKNGHVKHNKAPLCCICGKEMTEKFEYEL